jgi:hypothetical protein
MEVLITNAVSMSPLLVYMLSTDVEWVVESQLQFTELGPEGQLGARYTPWIFENAEYLTKGK